MKRKILKIVLIVLAIIVIAISGLVAWLKFALPKVGDAPELAIEITPERIAHGEYLANSVFACMDCHSHRDWNKFSGPLKEGTLGAGGEVFDQNLGLPGVFTSKNLTPFALEEWTDGEIFRAITTGVNKDGKALFPIMPYLTYGQMDPEDIYDVIAYLRSLPPIESNPAESKADFPMNLILNTIPKDATPGKRPDASDTLAYGAYVTLGASCAECHTMMEKGQLVEGMEFAGSREFRFPGGQVVRSANITPHPETGIGKWSEEQFLQKFRQYADAGYSPEDVPQGKFNSVMPWMMYAGMKEDDLRAIYKYLQSLKPIEHKIERFTP